MVTKKTIKATVPQLTTFNIHIDKQGVVMVVIVWYLDLQLPVQSVPINLSSVGNYRSPNASVK